MRRRGSNPQGLAKTARAFGMLGVRQSEFLGAIAERALVMFNDSDPPSLFEATFACHAPGACHPGYKELPLVFAKRVLMRLEEFFSSVLKGLWVWQKKRLRTDHRSSVTDLQKNARRARWNGTRAEGGPRFV